MAAASQLLLLLGEMTASANLSRSMVTTEAAAEGGDIPCDQRVRVERCGQWTREANNWPKCAKISSPPDNLPIKAVAAWKGHR